MMTTTKTLLTLSLLAGCAVDADTDSTEQKTTGMYAVVLPQSGTGQNREVMSGFDPLVVEVTNLSGEPMAGVYVTFTAPASGASAVLRAGGIVATDDNGRAEILPYANQIAGNYMVWAHADGADAMPFSLTNSAAPPAIVLPILGNNQQHYAGGAFADPLTVEVRDNFGNPCPDIPVSFEAPASGATTRMTNEGQTVTDDEGHASVFAVAGEVPGTYVVQANVIGAPSFPFVLTNTSTDGTIVLPNGHRLDLNIEFEQATAFK